MDTTFTQGASVVILSGKFATENATVVANRTDRNGVERVQVKMSDGKIFSYLPGSLRLVSAGSSASAGSAESTATVELPSSGTVSSAS